MRCCGTLEFLCDFHEQCHQTQRILQEKRKELKEANQGNEEQNKENVAESNKENISPSDSKENPSIKSLDHSNASDKLANKSNCELAVDENDNTADLPSNQPSDSPRHRSHDNVLADITDQHTERCKPAVSRSLFSSTPRGIKRTRKSKDVERKIRKVEQKKITDIFKVKSSPSNNKTEDTEIDDNIENTETIKSSEHSIKNEEASVKIKDSSKKQESKNEQRSDKTEEVTVDKVPKANPDINSNQFVWNHAPKLPEPEKPKAENNNTLDSNLQTGDKAKTGENVPFQLSSRSIDLSSTFLPFSKVFVDTNNAINSIIKQNLNNCDDKNDKEEERIDSSALSSTSIAISEENILPDINSNQFVWIHVPVLLKPEKLKADNNNTLDSNLQTGDEAEAEKNLSLPLSSNSIDLSATSTPFSKVFVDTNKTINSKIKQSLENCDDKTDKEKDCDVSSAFLSTSLAIPDENKLPDDKNDKADISSTSSPASAALSAGNQRKCRIKQVLNNFIGDDDQEEDCTSSKKKRKSSTYGKISDLISKDQKESIEKYYTRDMSVINENIVNKNYYINEKKQFICKLCNAIYPRIDKCRVHIWGHLDMKPYRCTACDFVTVTVSNIRCHIRKSHLKIKPFECHICNKRFVTAVLLEEHMNTHTGARPFKCKVCNYSSASRQVLGYHSLTHKEVKDIICDICKKQFYSKGQLRAHLITHNKDKTLMCKFCSHHFTTPEAVQRHYENIHSKDYICYTCGKRTKSRKALHNHQNVHSKGKHKCPICPNVYKSSHILKEHLLKHEGIRKYKCDTCNKDFAQQSHLAAHKAVHSEKRYFCPGCQRAFNRHDNMKMHTKRCENFLVNPELKSLLSRQSGSRATSINEGDADDINDSNDSFDNRSNKAEDFNEVNQNGTFRIGEVDIVPISNVVVPVNISRHAKVTVTESVIGLECF